MNLIVFQVLSLIYSVQCIKINFTDVGQSSTASNLTGASKAVDGDIFSSARSRNGSEEFWWGTFDVSHKIGWIFIVLGKGDYEVFISNGKTSNVRYLCKRFNTPPGYDLVHYNSTCMYELEGNTIKVQRAGIGPVILNEISPFSTTCPEGTHGFSCMPCHQNCEDGCSKVDGTCNFCKKTHFGRMCQRKCHDVCSDNTCDRDEGECRKESVVIIVIFFLCLVLIFAAIIGFVIKRRTKLFKLLKRPVQPRSDDVIVTYSTTNRNVAPSFSDHQVPSSPLSDCPVEYVHMIDGQNTIKMSPVEFIKYMKERQNVETLLKDLGSLPGWLMGRCFEAEKEENKPKNRSTTFLPYDRNRVVLEPSEEDQNDYINASYISSYRKEKAFILTLGPVTPDTVLDFWRMVWQTNCKCVIMLAALKEGEKKKCSKYWPDESGDCGPFFLLIQNTETFDDYLLRKILLRKNEETRRLVHFQCTSWGDAKRHKKINTLLRLRTHVNSFASSENMPIIIHSGPGISRMGIYIALDYLLKQGLKEDVIDVMDCVVKLRSQRAYILRDRKEHQFLLNALETGFRTELLERLEEESDEEQAEDLYVNEQKVEELYVNS